MLMRSSVRSSSSTCSVVAGPQYGLGVGNISWLLTMQSMAAAVSVFNRSCAFAIDGESLTKHPDVGCKKQLLLPWVENGSNTCLGEGSGSFLGAITQDLNEEFEPFWSDEARTEHEIDNSDKDYYLDEEYDSHDNDYVGGTENIPTLDVDVEVEVDEVVLNLSDKDTCSDDSDHDLIMDKRLRNAKRENLKQQESTLSNSK
ncbi:hypothetical protein L6452_26628 [Arctium lappa]|uniref:Uncharacterized protein n=1 Tax=Arctium lappa TaxID=4217 RepID=A0ACB8ZW03_ARCLA|nr:hypothetical protein L6452_26628 [Arctium lappa]